MSNQLQREQQERQPPLQQQTRKSSNKFPMQAEIPFETILRGDNLPQNNQQMRLSALVPVVKNPIRYYKGADKYQWKLEQLGEATCIEQLEINPIEQVELPYGQGIQIQVRDAKTEGSGMSKHMWYYVSGQDKNGQFQCRRRYSEYLEFRRKLSEQWIGIFMPVLPSGTIGNSEEEVTMRIKYIDNFWRALSLRPVIFGSEEVQVFLRSVETDMEVVLKVFTPTTIHQIMERYKNAFSEAYRTSKTEQFLFRFQNIPLQLEEYEEYFLKRKIVLSEYKDAFRRLTDAKTRYYRAMSKLDQQLMPQYEDVLTSWFTGAPLKQEPGLLERLSLRQSSKKKEAPKQEQKTTENGETNRGMEAPKEFPQKEQTSTGLFNSQAFKSRLEDTAVQIQNFNGPTWQIYDVINFELKNIDMVAAAIDQLHQIQQEIKYLKRSIGINKEQIEAVAKGKRTLKTFLMRGTEDEKRLRLTNQNTMFEEKLLTATELYHIMLVLMEQQLKDYHAERAKHYQNSMEKALVEDIDIARSIMQFHVYQSQLFGKQRAKRIEELGGAVKQVGDQIHEEIKE